MTVFRAQVVIPYFTGFPEDVITNTWHFQSPVVTSVNVASAALTPLLKSFYESAYLAGIASYLNWANTTVRFYSLDDPPPRVPTIVSLGWATGTSSATVVPTEVSLVLSFQATPQSGIPQARRRGRVYLGGISDLWLDASSGSSYPQFRSSALANVTGAASTLRSALIATGTYDWAVYSPTDATDYPITNGWVDTSPDTQRRRGVRAASRTLWT